MLEAVACSSALSPQQMELFYTIIQAGGVSLKEIEFNYLVLRRKEFQI